MDAESPHNSLIERVFVAGRGVAPQVAEEVPREEQQQPAARRPQGAEQAQQGAPRRLPAPLLPATGE